LDVFVVSGGLFCAASESGGFVVDVVGHHGGVPVEVVEDVLSELYGVVRGWDAVPVVPEGSEAPGGVSVAFSGLKQPLEDFFGEVPAWGGCWGVGVGGASSGGVVFASGGEFSVAVGCGCGGELG
jgi:hypothetical protein